MNKRKSDEIKGSSGEFKPIGISEKLKKNVIT